MAWQAIGNTLFGYGAWNWLLARHNPASTVTPKALLVPVFGMTASALALHEGLPTWKLGAAALVMGGLGQCPARDAMASATRPPFLNGAARQARVLFESLVSRH